MNNKIIVHIIHPQRKWQEAQRWEGDKCVSPVLTIDNELGSSVLHLWADLKEEVVRFKKKKKGPGCNRLSVPGILKVQDKKGCRVQACQRGGRTCTW